MKEKSTKKSKSTTEKVIMKPLKCPFMGGSDCVAENCALWVHERVTMKDFQAGSRLWQDKEVVMPAHCALNTENTKTFVRIIDSVNLDGDVEKEPAPDICGKTHKTNDKIDFRNSIYVS